MNAPAEIVKPITFPPIDEAKGERYAGILLGKNGAPSKHLVMVATRNEGMEFKDNLAWAETTGGRAPDRRELHLLKTNLPECFEDNWYWSGEVHAERSDCAWFQSFYFGGQDWGYQINELFGVSVRSVDVE